MKNYKNIMTLIIGLLLGQLAQSQTVEPFANGGFEEWDTIETYSEPKKWYTLNSLINFGFEPTAEITTDANSGNYALKLVAKSGQFRDLSGVVCSGSMLNEYFQPDFSKMKMPFNKRPSALRFAYKATFPIPDSAIVAFNLTKWNASTNQSDTVGEAALVISSTSATYQTAVINIKYYSNQTPDSAYFIATSSADGFNPIVGSTLFLDDVALLYYQTSVENTSADMGVKVWPNPSKGSLNIYYDGAEQKAKAVIKDLQGKTCLTQVIERGENSLNLNNVETGIYYLKVVSGTKVNITKLIIE